MADLNALIAQGAQFQAMPDPFVQYGRMQQLEQGQQANQLNRMKMQEMQAANAERNALSNFLPSLNESNRSQLLNYGETGRGIYKTITEGDTQRRLSEQATSQAAVNKSNILKNVIAQTRDAVAGIDPADAGSYGTLRGSVLEQYPELAPYMPEIWDDKTKQRLIATASSVLEGQKPVTPSLSPLAKLQAEMKALPPGDPRIQQYVAAINKEITRAPGTNITMVSERAEQGARGKMLVDQYGDISKAAGLAARTLPSIEANLSALNKGFDTGFGKETVAAGASVLAALGVKDAEKFATDSQMFQSNAINAVLQKQLEQKGPQTESDAKRIEQIGAQLGKTKDANEFILATAKEQLKRDIDQRNFYDRWYKTNKTYDGAEDSWFTGEGGKSLFDRPALKKYAAAPPPSSASLIPGSTPAAGGGSTVTLPDGRVKTFPNAAAANQFKKAAGL